MFEYGCLEISDEIFLDLYYLFKEIKQMIEDETVFPFAQKVKPLKIYNLEDQFINLRICNFCGADIWNRFFHCDRCDDCDLCLWCVAEGRNCIHRSLKLYEYFSEVNLMDFENRSLNCLIRIKSKVRQNDHILDFFFKSKKTTSIASLAWIINSTMDERFYCHQCKYFLESNIKKCCSICKIIYCGKCLWKNYQLRHVDLSLAETEFCCPRCKNKCTCQSCIQNMFTYNDILKNLNLQKEIYVNQFRVPSIILDEKRYLVPSTYDRITFNRALSMKAKYFQ